MRSQAGEPTPDELAERMEKPVGGDADSRLGQRRVAARDHARRAVAALRAVGEAQRKLRHPSRSEQLRSFLIED